MNNLLSNKIQTFSTNINILRFVCAILVIISHSYSIVLNQYDFISRWFNNQVSLGGIAVAIFFFLSGLYVTKSLMKSKSSVDFIRKRIVRIFPQLFIVVLFCIFIIGPIFSTYSILDYFKSIDTYKYVLNIFFIPKKNLPGVFESGYFKAVNGPLWTLPVEFMCYIAILIIYILVRKLSTKENEEKMFKILFWMANITSFTIFILLLYIIKSIFLITAFRPICFFFVGCMYFLYKDKIILNPFISIIMLIALPFLRTNNLFNVFSLIFIPYIIVSLMLGTRQIGFNNKIFNISYEMYLLGWPVQQMVNSVFKNNTPFLNTIISVPIDIILSYILYAIVEHILNRENKWLI